MDRDQDGTLGVHVCAMPIGKYCKLFFSVIKKMYIMGFITNSYIAAYIQMQYRVGGVHPTGLTVARAHSFGHI